MLSNAIAFRYNRKERRQIRIARKAELDAKRKLGQIRKVLEIPGLAAPKEEEAMSKLASVKQELTRDLFLDHMLTRSERRQQQRLKEAEEATSFEAKVDDLTKLASDLPTALENCRNGISSAPPSEIVSDQRSDESGAEGSDDNDYENSGDVNSVASDLTDEFSGSEVDAAESMYTQAPAPALVLSCSAASALNLESSTDSIGVAASNQPLPKMKHEAHDEINGEIVRDNGSKLAVFLDSFGRHDLVQPLTKAGIYSPTQLGKAGDAVLLGPSVGLKPEEVIDFRKACQLIETASGSGTGALYNHGSVNNFGLILPSRTPDGNNSDASIAHSDSDATSNARSGSDASIAYSESDASIAHSEKDGSIAMSNTCNSAKSTSSLSNASVVSAPKEISSPKENFLAAVKLDWRAVQNTPAENFAGNREIMLAALKQSDSALQYASDELLDDFEFMMNAVVLCGDALQYASKALRQDKAVVKAAASQDGYALRYASRGLRDDRDFVLSVCAQSGCALSHASPELQNDREVVLTAVVKDGMALAFASRELRSDSTVVRTAVSQSGCALQFATKKQRSDRRTARLAALNNGLALQYAGATLRNDEDVAISAISQNGDALQFASVTMRSNRDVVLCAKGGYALKFASPECQADREVVVAACSQNGCALQFASPELRRDRSLVRIAAMNDWRAMQWADDALRADRHFILDISSSNWRVLDYASPELRTEQGMIEVCNGYQAFEVFKKSVLAEREAALASILPNAANHHGDKTHKDAHASTSEGEILLKSSVSPHNAKNVPGLHMDASSMAKVVASSNFDENTTGEQSYDNEHIENSSCSTEDQHELVKKSVRFSDSKPAASLSQVASMEDYSSSSKSLYDPLQPQSRETSTDTPMSVLSPPEGSEHTSTIQAKVSTPSVALPEGNTSEPGSSSSSSIPNSACQHQDDIDESNLEAILDAHGRADLLLPLKKAGIRSPMKFARAGDSLLLSPLLGMKPGEVKNFRLVLSEIPPSSK